MPSLAEFIEGNRERILERWREVAQTTASARGLSRPELFNLLPVYLSFLAQSQSEEPALSGEQHRLIEAHLSNRLRQGYELTEVLFEFSLLGRTVSRLIDEQPASERPSPVAVAGLFSELLLTCDVATRIFTEHLLEDEQREKRYARLISKIAEESLVLHGRTIPLTERLREVLALIMEAMAAQTA